MLSISRRLFISNRSIALVNRMDIRNAGRNITKPIIRIIQLLNLNCVVIKYVIVPAIADERRIFAEESQSTVTL